MQVKTLVAQQPLSGSVRRADIAPKTQPPAMPCAGPRVLRNRGAHHALPATAQQRSDSDLIQRIVGGDQTAMTMIYDRYAGIALTVAMRYLRNRSSAEDVVQDLFLLIWHRPEMITPNASSLKAWIAAVVRNRCLDHLRRRVKYPTFSPEDVVLANPQDYEALFAQQTMAGQAAAIVDTLPETMQTIVKMAFYNGWTHTEIAEHTGLSLGTVKTRIRRSLLIMRDALSGC